MTSSASQSFARRARPVLVTAVLLGAIHTSCGEDVELGMMHARQPGSGAAGSASAGVSADGAACTVRPCGKKIFECGDCVDNDGDGRIDADDPACLGPCDDSESVYYRALPGQDAAPCILDCFFDQDSGSGNDGCAWSHRCDPLSVPPDLGPSGNPLCAYNPALPVPGDFGDCESLARRQSDQCLAVCGPLTPNGCDCFGCCELPAGSGRFVWIGSREGWVGTCDPESLDDPERCRPCTPVMPCFKPCERCQLCAGRTELPGDCLDPDAAPDPGERGQCPLWQQPCGLPGQAPCPGGTYCISGCCTALPR